MPADEERTLPNELLERLAAASIDSPDALQAALDADPELAAGLQALAEDNPEFIAGLMLAPLLNRFAAVSSGEEMLDFWRSVPEGLEEELMDAVEEAIAQAQADGETEKAAALTSRLNGFRAIHQQATAAQEMSPTQRAVLAFFQADDEAAAAALFAEQKTLLQPYEAQRFLDSLAAQAATDTPDEIRHRLTSRAALLRQLRGAVPTPAPQSPDRPVTQSPISNSEYLFSAHAEGGGRAEVVNNIFLQGLERRWQRPTPPRQPWDAVPRPGEMAAVRTALAQRGAAAISGQNPLTASALAVQGAPGVGKSTLARLIALEAEQSQAYADGVLWQELGPDHLTPEQCQPILRAWAAYATGFFGLPENLDKLFHFEPEAVRSLLAEHPRLLVVLDNVWSRAAIRPLEEALPPNAHLIVTTRQREIAQGLRAGLVEVGLLQKEEAGTLFGLRLGWQPGPDDPGADWAGQLMAGVGFHALGLDVALGVLRRYGDGPTEWQAESQRLLAALQTGQMARLHLGADDPGHNVRAVLLYSYRALADDESRRRLRWLAAFAPEAEFATDLAGAAWGCDGERAFESLTDFANGHLLERLAGGRWRQHGLLRTLGLALLSESGEREAARHAHSRAYAQAMRQADDEQHYYTMLPDLAQLAHAFAWAVGNDLELAPWGSRPTAPTSTPNLAWPARPGPGPSNCWPGQRPGGPATGRWARFTATAPTG